MADQFESKIRLGLDVNDFIADVRRAESEVNAALKGLQKKQQYVASEAGTQGRSNTGQFLSIAESDAARAAQQTAFAAQAEAKLVTAQTLKAARLAAQQSTDLEYISSSVKLSTGYNLRAAALAEGKAADDDYVISTVDLAASRKNLSATISEAQAADSEYIASTVRVTTARAELAAAEKSALLTTIREAQAAGLPSVATFQGEAAAATQESNLVKQLAQQEAILAEGNQTIELKAQANANQAKINELIRQQENVYREQAGLPARAASGSGRSSSALSSLLADPLGFIGSKLATTAGFAASAGAFYATYNGLQQVFKQTVALQTQFSLLQTQMQQTDNQGAFSETKRGILEVARDTGVAADQIAQLAITVQGAFQGTQGAGPQQTIEFLQQAAQLSRTSGLSLTEAANSLVAIVYTFGISAKEVNDTAVGLHNTFGTATKDIITFAATTAPVAEEMGATAQQIEAIGAATQRASGRTGVSLAEGISRVLPNIQGHISDILAAYQEIPDKQQSIVDAISSGNTFDVLIELIKDWDLLGKTQQNVLLSALGGGRQAPLLASVFGDPQLLQQLTNPTDFTGAAQKQFENLQETIGQSFSELKQQAIQLGAALAQAGIVPILTDIGNAIKLLIQFITPFVSLLASISSGLKGLGGVDVLAKIVEAVALIKGAQAFGNARSGGASLPSSIGQAATLGLRSRGATGSAVAEAELASQGTVIGGEAAVAMTAGAQRFSGGFFSGIRNSVAQFAANKTAVLQLAGGASLAVAGQAIGGTTGNYISAIGTGLAVGAINPLAGLVVGGAQILETYFSAAREAKEKQKDLESRYADLARTPAGLAKLRDIAGSGATVSTDNNPLDKYIGGDLLGLKSPTKPAPQVVAAKNALDRQAVNSARSQLKAIQAQLSPDDKTYKEISNVLHYDADQPLPLAAAGLTSTVKYIFDQISKGVISGVDLSKVVNKNQRDVVNALKKGSAAGASDAQQSILDTSLQDLQEGLISGQTYVSQLQDLRSLYSKYIASSQTSGRTLDPDALKQINQIDAAISKYTSDAIKSRLDALHQIDQFTGQDSSQGDIARATEALNAVDNQGHLTLTDQGDRAAVVSQLFTDYQAALTAKIDGIKDAAGKLAAASQGIAVDPGAQVAILSQIVDQAINASNVSVADLEGFATSINSTLPDLEAKIVGVAQQTGLSVRDAFLRLLQDMYATALSALDTLAEGYNSIYFVTTDEQAAADKVNQLQKEIDQITSSQGLNITLPDVSKITGSQQQLASLGSQAASEARDLALAQAAYAQALVSNDPVAAAQAAINTADVAAANAQTETERVQAATQRVQAEHQLQDAIIGIADAQAEYAVALAANAGDTVGAAQKATDAAYQKLLEGYQRGAGLAELTQLQEDVINKQAATRDAALQNQEDTIAFNLQVQKISQAQAVAEYRALLDQADLLGLTVTQRRDLEEKIFSLTQSLSQDAQFNLPSELALPTLYEGRRFVQSGGNYQDNRNVQIILNATNAIDGEAAIHTIVSALNQPPRTGNNPRMY